MFKRYGNLYALRGYIKRHTGFIKRLIFVMLFTSSLGMLLPYIVSKRLLSIADPNFKIVLALSGAIMSIITVHHIFWYFWEKLGSVLTQNIALDMRREMVSAFVSTNLSDIRDKSSGYYLERLTDDVNEIAAIPSNILGVFADCATNFTFLIIIYFLSVPCGVIFTLGVLIVFIINSFKIKVDLRYTEKLKALSELSASKVSENFAGIRDIKALGIKSKIVTSTADIFSETAYLQMEKDKKIALFPRLKTFTMHFTESLLIVFSVGFLMPDNHISIVVLLTIINYGGFMYDLVEYVASIKDWLVRGDYKASRVIAVMSKDNEEVFGDTDVIDRYDIELKNLVYSYDDGEELYNGLSLVIPERTATLFAGLSGGGKSTLLYIMTKLLKCHNGMVFIGGSDINSLTETAIRESVCLITQEPFLINDTVFENIRIVKPNATDGEVIRACKSANIHDEIMALAGGYNATIAMNGSNLSGGQKQRLSIARAYLKDTPILMFDEPTSHLDAKNRDIFYQTIRELKKEKTILIVAHQQTADMPIDKSYSLVDGKLYENNLPLNSNG